MRLAFKVNEDMRIYRQEFKGIWFVKIFCDILCYTYEIISYHSPFNSDDKEIFMLYRKWS